MKDMNCQQAEDLAIQIFGEDRRGRVKHTLLSRHVDDNGNYVHRRKYEDSNATLIIREFYPDSNTTQTLRSVESLQFHTLDDGSNICHQPSILDRP